MTTPVRNGVYQTGQDDLAKAYLAGTAAKRCRQELNALLCVLPWGSMPPAALNAAQRLVRFASGESVSLDAEFQVVSPQSIAGALASAYSRPKRRGRKGKRRGRKPPVRSRAEVLTRFFDAMGLSFRSRGIEVTGDTDIARELVKRDPEFMLQERLINRFPREHNLKRIVRGLANRVSTYRKRAHISGANVAAINPIACEHETVLLSTQPNGEANVEPEEPSSERV